jgi:restriction system protein
MGIWHYEHAIEGDDIARRTHCMFCRTELLRDKEDEKAVSADDQFPGYSVVWDTLYTPRIGICPACGWWKYDVPFFESDSPSIVEVKLASLKELDLADVSTPIKDVRDYLTARYESRFEVHPRVFEEVVADVFRDHGYRAVVTAYSGDAGIDVILEGDDRATIGVQVKRYRGRIQVDQIRELTGALVLEGHTRGIFITTSAFQAGATDTALRSAQRGYPIELWDARRFLDALKIAQLTSSTDVIALKPWRKLVKNRERFSKMR